MFTEKESWGVKVGQYVGFTLGYILFSGMLTGILILLGKITFSVKSVGYVLLLTLIVTIIGKTLGRLLK